MSLCAMMLVKDAEVAQLTCHACSCVLQEVQCGDADAMPKRAAAVGRHASTRASTKTHTANRH